MTQTFEELAGREIDPLYQGALFLCAGDRRCAEDLLVDSLTAAAGEYSSTAEVGEVGRWLRARLARSFLGRSTGSPARSAPARLRRSRARGGAAGLEAEQLFDAARELPAEARAALWLVLLERCSYVDAAEVLGVDRDRLRELIGYGKTLMERIAESRPDHGDLDAVRK